MPIHAIPVTEANWDGTGMVLLEIFLVFCCFAIAAAAIDKLGKSSWWHSPIVVVVTLMLAGNLLAAGGVDTSGFDEFLFMLIPASSAVGLVYLTIMKIVDLIKLKKRNK